ncbi:MAG: Stp1/IreP family PP2C-type Ser/Thr phosphatase [Gammaproteobacteria bacterium]|nr:Stp1/IreP family PP2C-type Ser/Thr phosphatase [Gammaproteobacteria bacterium]
MLANGMKLAVYGLSDVGLSREHNEDSISWDIDLGLIMLADGMGGHNAGEVASELAVTAIRDALLDVLTPDMLDTKLIKCDEALREAVIYANEEIHEQANRRTECAGMGTTVVITLFHEDKVTYAHVGDSRIYRVRHGEIKQLTQDHSLVQEMIDNGYLSQEEAMLSSSRNLITRALGIAPDVEVDVRTETIDNDDVYLLCSDGLSDLINGNDMVRIINTQRDSLGTAAQQLVDLANERGGTDNISVILVAMHEAFSDEHGLSPTESQEVETDGSGE